MRDMMMMKNVENDRLILMAMQEYILRGFSVEDVCKLIRLEGDDKTTFFERYKITQTDAKGFYYECKAAVEGLKAEKMED